MDNKIILKQMIRLSRVIKDFKEARCRLNSALSQSTYFVVEGKESDLIRNQGNQSIANILYNEQYLHITVSNACTHLDGFDRSRMDPINYISSNDITNRFVDICRNGKIVANINLTTGEISIVKNPEYEKMVEDKNPAEKS